ncbi:hypothetical protein PGTUg99_035556 [Puccinia graminis f. sp. tritici]|uniref:Ribophorin II C-terminal domain-containing protein n=1 Tax=Puccinia graminis f. sp. tritici TaxID=56615 RepID=A0A5B0N6J9_PUCGR|nr:hypothetical protein PGTUg99_035556 [Puccinia graminis f. sp. tritici]
MARITRTVGKPLILALALLAVWLPSGSAELVVDNGQLVVLDVNGMTKKSFEISTNAPSPLAPPFELNDENTLKATFEILEKSSSDQAGSLFSPHQVTLLATGLDTKLHWATAVKTRSKGKAKWELWAKISQNTTGGFKLFGAPKLSTLLFILTMVSQEALILTYWARLKLYQYIPLAFLMSFPLILCGRTALSELRLRRKISPISVARVSSSRGSAGDD